jgi:hypothetical protein
MESEKTQQATSLRIESLHLTKQNGDPKFKKERSERGSLAASSGRTWSGVHGNVPRMIKSVSKLTVKST